LRGREQSQQIDRNASASSEAIFSQHQIALDRWNLLLDESWKNHHEATAQLFKSVEDLFCEGSTCFIVSYGSDEEAETERQLGEGCKVNLSFKVVKDALIVQKTGPCEDVVVVDGLPLKSSTPVAVRNGSKIRIGDAMYRINRSP
jgi:hypothetical protein